MNMEPVSREAQTTLAELAAIAAADHIIDNLQAGDETAAYEMRNMAIDMVAAVAPYGGTPAKEVVDAACVVTMDAQASVFPGSEPNTRHTQWLERRWQRVVARERIEIPDFDTL